MKFLDKVWNTLGLVDVDEAEETASKTAAKQEPINRHGDELKQKKATVTELRPVTSEAGLKKTSVRIVISEPTSFDDAKQIAENVTDQRPVIVNFEKTDSDTMKRTVDFMSGITYAVGGSVQRVSGTIFLFAPGSVDILNGDSLPDEGRSFIQWEKR